MRHIYKTTNRTQRDKDNEKRAVMIFMKCATTLYFIKWESKPLHNGKKLCHNAYHFTLLMRSYKRQHQRPTKHFYKTFM